MPINHLPSSIEPICSWRLNNPQLELKVTSDGESIRYSVYNHHCNIKRYWPSSASSPTDLIPVFAHCVWKGMKKRIENRLFSDGQAAVCVSVNSRTKKIGIKEWEEGALGVFLTKKNPIISAVNNDHSVEFQEEIRETLRDKPYDPEAEEGITRWRRTEEGELVLFEAEPISEKTVKVWPGPRDIRLIKFVDQQREEILFRVFDWENKENLEVPSRLASCASSNLSSKVPFNIDAVIQKIQKYVPELENVQNEEVITVYREHPLHYFMPKHILPRTEASEVEKWVYEQFYRKEEENKLPFEYTNFVSAKKIAFSFNKKAYKHNKIGVFSEVETWHIEMKRQGGWALQFPIGISNFFTEMFLTSAQNPTLVDQKAMERLVRGVPLFDKERNQIVDDFALELGNCSTINFYIACDRSLSQLEINGRAWVRSFANAGKGLGHLMERANLVAANRTIENAIDFVESTNKLRQELQVLREVSTLKAIQEVDKNA